MYTFVKITNYYRTFLAECYTSHPGLESTPYDEQLNVFLQQRFGWSDYYSRNLRTLGVDSHEIIANAVPLQQTWAKERGLIGSMDEILFAQIAHVKPDVVFLQDSIRFGGKWIDELRLKVPSIKLVIGWYCSPMSSTQETALRGCDFVMCCSPLFTEKLARIGIQTYLQPHAFEPSILQEIVNNPYPHVDFQFIGSILSGTGYHGLRQQVLDRLIADGIEIDMYASIDRLPASDLWKRRLAYVTAHTLKAIGLEPLAQSLPNIRKGLLLNEYPRTLKNVEAIARRSKPSIYGLEMFKALAHARIAFNIHGDVAGEYAANIRLFEVTGVGSCLITDWKKNLGDYFDDGEIVSFRSIDECVEKVRWLLNHKEECAAIAKRGQQRTLRDHTYHTRAVQLHEIIMKHLR
jgi:spore maturation protein CgeB